MVCCCCRCCCCCCCAVGGMLVTGVNLSHAAGDTELQQKTEKCGTGGGSHGALHTAGTNRHTHTHVFSNMALCTLREQTDTHMSSATWRFAHCGNKQTHTHTHMSSATWRFAHCGNRHTHKCLQQHGALHSAGTDTHSRLQQHGALHTA